MSSEKTGVYLPRQNWGKISVKSIIRQDNHQGT